MNNWRLLLLAVVAVLLPVGSFTERNLLHGREQCCDHRSDFPETGLHGSYQKSTQEDRRLNTRLLADRFDTSDSRRHETRSGNPLTHSDKVSVERRLAEPERSVRNQERQNRNLPKSRLSRIASSRRDLTRNDRISLDSIRRNLADTRSERRTRDVDLNRNSRTENERRMSVRTERNEIRKEARPTEESIRHEIRLKNERVVLRLRENIRDSRQFRISEDRRELRQISSNAERRQIIQLRESKESVERRDTRNVERIARDELEQNRVNRAMQLSRSQQQRSGNRQSRDREFSMLRENVRREEKRRLSRDPLDSGALRMREIRSLERLERVRDSRDLRTETRSNERLERTSENSRVSEDRVSRIRESREAEPQRTASVSRVQNARQRLKASQHSNDRNNERLEVRNPSIGSRGVFRTSVRKDSEMSRRIEVADRAERNFESERRIINADRKIERIDSRISEERRDTRRMSRDDSTRVAQKVPTRVDVRGQRTRDEVRDIAREMRERSDVRNFRNSDRHNSRTEFNLNRERSSLERGRNLDVRNTLSSVRNIEREVTRDRRSLDNRSDSRGKIRLNRERSSLERSRNWEARNILSSIRNVRDTEREVTRDRRSVDDRADSRREFRLSRERSLERSRSLDTRNTLSAVRNVRENQRESTRDQRFVNRIDSRRERTTLERSRSLEARYERETKNRAVRNERQTHREHNERSMAIRPETDRLAMEQNDRTMEFRNDIRADLFRVHENVINEKTENQDGVNWQYMFYTLQAAYLCGLLVQILTENSMKPKTKNFSWWLPASSNQIKVD